MIRVDFDLGFRVQPRINMLFTRVLTELDAYHELEFRSKYEHQQGRISTRTSATCSPSVSCPWRTSSPSGTTSSWTPTTLEEARVERS